MCALYVCLAGLPFKHHMSASRASLSFLPDVCRALLIGRRADATQLPYRKHKIVALKVICPSCSSLLASRLLNFCIENTKKLPCKSFVDFCLTYAELVDANQVLVPVYYVDGMEGMYAGVL